MAVKALLALQTPAARWSSFESPEFYTAMASTMGVVHGAPSKNESECRPNLVVELFGGLRVHSGSSDPAELPPQQAGALLAYLSLNPGRPHHREELIELLWPDVDTLDGRQRLRQALYTLHKLLETLTGEAAGALQITRTEVRLDPWMLQTDVGAFEEALHAAHQKQNPSERIECLQRAIALYRGPLFPGCYLDPVVVAGHRLAELHRSALRELSVALRQSGNLDLAIETARILVAEDALDEESRCLLMRLYAEKGQPSEALRQYRELERILQSELEVAPSPRTQKTLAEIRSAERGIPVSQTSAGVSARPDTELPIASPAGILDPPAARRLYRPKVWQIAFAAFCFGALFWLIHANRSGASRPARKNATATAVPSNSANPALPIPAGAYCWVARYMSEPDERGSEAKAITGDSLGNIYATGLVQTTHNDSDLLTVKFSPDGKQLWRRRFNGEDNDVDVGQSIAVDDEQNIYVTGETMGKRGNGTTRLSGLNWVTVKYDPNGREQWRDVYNGEDDGEDVPVKVLLGRDGDIWIAGNSRSRLGGDDFVILKLRANGSRAFQPIRIDGKSHGDDRLADAALDGDGNLYVTGRSRANVYGAWETDYLTARIDRNGKVAWMRRYGEANRADDVPKTIGLDHMGRVYVVGEGRGPKGSPDENKMDCITMCYSPQGDVLWGPRGALQEGERIPQVMCATVDDDGRVTISGKSPPAADGALWRTVERDPQGASVWVTDFPGGDYMCSPVGLSSSFLVGTTFTAKPRRNGDSRDLVALRFGPNGSITKRWHFDSNSDFDVASTITTIETRDHVRSTIVAGQSWGGKSRDIVLLKLRP